MISAWLLNILLAAGIGSGIAGIIVTVKNKKYSGNIFALVVSMICVSALYCVIQACGSEIQESSLIQVLIILGICLQITLCNLLVFSRETRYRRINKNVKKR